MTAALPHTVTVHLHDGWIEHAIVCPYTPDDPDRPCRGFVDWPECDPSMEEPGCAAADWLDNVDLDGMLDGFDDAPVPCPVAVAWDGDCWVLRPWPAAVTP